MRVEAHLTKIFLREYFKRLCPLTAIGSYMHAFLLPKNAKYYLLNPSFALYFRLFGGKKNKDSATLKLEQLKMADSTVAVDMPSPSAPLTMHMEEK